MTNEPRPDALRKRIRFAAWALALLALLFYLGFMVTTALKAAGVSG